MQFKFDANQEYQIKAVEAAVNLLEGQQRISGASVFIGRGDGQTSLLPPEQRGQYLLSEILPGTIANTLNLTEDDLLTNLKNVQKAHGVEPDSALVFIEELIETAAGQKKARFPNYSIEGDRHTPIRSSATVSPFSPEAQRLMTASIVTFALCESVAIYGLVLFLIQGDSGDFYLFLALSLFFYSVYFPRYGKWEEWIKERQRELARRPQA